MSLTINGQYDPGCHAAQPRDRRLRFGMEIWDGHTQAPLRARHSPAPPGWRSGSWHGQPSQACASSPLRSHIQAGMHSFSKNMSLRQGTVRFLLFPCKFPMFTNIVLEQPTASSKTVNTTYVQQSRGNQ